jgi:hypothetical protein
MQLCGTHISAAVNQHATLEEVVFSVGLLHNEDLAQLESIEFRDASLPGYELGSRGIELRESMEAASWQNNGQ